MVLSSYDRVFCYLLQGKTMIGQNVLLELVEGDKVQLYAYTATGITDHKASHYTQFIGLLMRPSVDSLHEVVRRLGAPDFDEDVSLAAAGDNDASVRSSASTLRGSVNGESSRRAGGRKGGGGGSSSSAIASRIMSPPPQDVGVGNGIHTLAISEEPEILMEKENRSKQEAKGSKEKQVNRAETEEKDKKEQSYLALTGLGGGGPAAASSPKSARKSAGKSVQNGVAEISPAANGKKASGGSKDKSPKKGSVAELASSTLKGFSKM